MLLHALEGIGIAATSLLAFAGAWALWRGGGGVALETLQVANRVLADEVRELKTAVARLTVENARLLARTDFTSALAPLLALAEKQEKNAEVRHAQTLVVLDLIAKHVGPDRDEQAA